MNLTRLLAVVAALSALTAEGKLASWYGDELRGRPVANGKPFDPDALTAASWYFPLGTRVRVTHGTNSVEVLITDRGPNRRFKEREIDLSRAAFKLLAPLDKGLIAVTVKKICDCSSCP